jgi:hypothetical protein
MDQSQVWGTVFGQLPPTDAWFNLFLNNSIPTFYHSRGAGLAARATANPVPLNEWHHLAWRRVGDQVQIFLDGSLVASNTNPAAINSHWASLVIGQGVANNSFQGWIDEARIYRGAVSAEAIAAFANPDAEADTDGDGVKDWREWSFAGSLAAGQDDDPDGDGIPSSEELDRGTNPLTADTDGDGLADGEEIARGFDPTRANYFDAELLVHYDFESGSSSHRSRTPNRGVLGRPGILNGFRMDFADPLAEPSPTGGRALRKFFDNDYVDTGFTASDLGILGDSAFTMMAWVKPEANPSSPSVFGPYEAAGQQFFSLGFEGAVESSRLALRSR